MADEVYKILQSRLRRNAQHTNCRDQQPDCDVYINTLSEDTNSHARKKIHEKFENLTFFKGLKNLNYALRKRFCQKA